MVDVTIGIIGGGVNGAAVAYFLSRLGDEEVVVFERDNIASGSTGYSAGIARSYYSTAHHIRIAKRGIEILRNLEAFVGANGGFRQCGYMRFVSEGNEDALRRVVRLQQQAGVDAELLDPAELSDYHPGLNTDGISLGMIDRDGGFADPYLVTTGFIQQARDLGATVHTGMPVVDLAVSGESVTHIETPNDTHRVDFVVNAAGPWADRIGQMAGIELPLRWHESKIAVLTAKEPYGPDFPVFSDHSCKPDMYVKPETGGEFIVGGIDRPPVDRAAGLTGVDTAHLNQISSRIDHRLPGFADAEVSNTWSGIITMTPDSHQIVGVPDSLDNFYNIVGGSGHGFKDAPGFAESIAQTILGHQPAYDLTPYRLERFEESDTIQDVDEKTHGY